MPAAAAFAERLGVSMVMVENGTLPENLTYTEALYRYGARHRLGRFVFWRDHDLMWQSEPGIAEYGRFPYPGVPAGHRRPAQRVRHRARVVRRLGAQIR